MFFAQINRIIQEKNKKRNLIRKTYDNMKENIL